MNINRFKNKEVFIRAGGKDLEILNSDGVIFLFKMFKYFAVINFVWIDVTSSKRSSHVLWNSGNINSNEINNSKIFEHFEQIDHPIRVEDFKILTSCPNEDLFILESIYIHKLNPTLNERNSSFDLCILKWLGRYWCMYFWIGITIIILKHLL